ncbi:MAG: hypothetical protein ABI651_16480, partial [Verrucomicrobiota bacterium]
MKNTPQTDAGCYLEEGQVGDESGDQRAPNNTAPTTVPPRNHWLTYARIATTARVVFIILALVAFAYLARAVVLPVLLAWVASMTLKAPVRWLRACRVPTPLAAAIIVGLFVAGTSFAVLRLGRPAVEWFAAAPETFPR